MRGVLRTIGTILLSFLVAAVAGAFVWSRVVDLPRVTRVQGGTSLDEEQLGKLVGIDGWYAVIAVVLAMVLGVVVMRRSRIDPVATVLVLAAGGALAGWVMLRAGEAFGPDNPSATITSLAVGRSLPVQLTPHAQAVQFAWPLAALAGALLVLLGVTGSRRAPVEGGDEDEPVADRVRATRG